MLKQLLLVFFVSLFSITGLTVTLLAQSDSSTGSGLSISPTRTELSIERGQADIIKMSVRNVTNGDIVAKVFVNDFESDGETGEPKLLPETDTRRAPSIKPFLVGVTDLDLKKGERQNFDIPVQVPVDAAPGAYYGVIRYAAIPASNKALESGEVSLTASVGTIVMIEVPGEIRQQVQAKDVLFYRKNVPGTIFSAKPEEIGIRIGNQGNGFVKPFGSVTVSNPLGKQVHQYEINDTDPRSNILPSSTRIFKDPVSGVGTPGRYVATANVSFGNGGEILTIRGVFWYLPWWSVLAVTLFIVLIVLMIGWVKKHATGHKYKKVRH